MLGMIEKRNEEKALTCGQCREIVTRRRELPRRQMKEKRTVKTIKPTNRLVTAVTAVTAVTPATFKERCAAECARLGVDRLTPNQLANVRAVERADKAAAAAASMVGRVAISTGKESIHMATGTSRVRVLFGRQATAAEIALGIRAQIAALEVRSSGFTVDSELAHRAAGQMATLRSRLASL